MIIIYHASCYDGFCAAWLLHKLFPDADYQPFQYGDEAPDVAGQNVIIADFSFPESEMIRMQNEAMSFLCFDHHKTVSESVRNLPGVTFDVEKSGARLVWEYFADDIRAADGLVRPEPPFQVKYTEDRDLWRWELSYSREVNAGMRLVEFDFDAWDRMNFFDLEKAGSVLCRYFDKKAANIAHKSKDVIVSHGVDDLKIPCVNCADGDMISLVGEQLAIREGTPFGMTYFFDGDQFIFSLRSRGNFDVSEVAKSFGGGGHRNAAGFSRPEMFPAA